MLLQLGLPSFGRGNWKSTIRKEARQHPDYHDLSPWIGSETADIVYQDSESYLTALLIEHGYLPEEQWREVTPQYYIEVKTTTGSCESPFFTSKSQYSRVSCLS